MADVQWIFELVDQFTGPAKLATEQLAKLESTVLANVRAINELASAEKQAARAINEVNKAANAQSKALGKSFADIGKEASKTAALTNKNFANMWLNIGGRAAQDLANKPFSIIKEASKEAFDYAQGAVNKLISGFQLLAIAAAAYGEVAKKALESAAKNELADLTIKFVLKDPAQLREYQEYLKRAATNYGFSPQQVKAAAQPLLGQTKNGHETANAFDLSADFATRQGKYGDIEAIKGYLGIFTRAATREGIPTRQLVGLLEAQGVTEKEFLEANGFKGKKGAAAFGQIGNVHFDQLISMLDKVNRANNGNQLAGTYTKTVTDTTVAGATNKFSNLFDTYLAALSDSPAYDKARTSLQHLYDVLSPNGPNAGKIAEALSHIFDGLAKLFDTLSQPAVIDNLIVQFDRFIKLMGWLAGNIDTLIPIFETLIGLWVIIKAVNFATELYKIGSAILGLISRLRGAGGGAEVAEDASAATATTILPGAGNAAALGLGYAVDDILKEKTGRGLFDRLHHFLGAEDITNPSSGSGVNPLPSVPSPESSNLSTDNKPVESAYYHTPVNIVIEGSVLDPETMGEKIANEIKPRIGGKNAPTIENDGRSAGV